MRKTKDNRNNKISDFYCTCCGHKGIPVVRKVRKEKEPGHLKKIILFFLWRRKNMVEIKPNGKYTLIDFEIEFHGGNFINGERIKPYKQFINDFYKGVKY